MTVARYIALSLISWYLSMDPTNRDISGLHCTYYCGDKTLLQLSYLHKECSYTDKPLSFLHIVLLVYKKSQGWVVLNQSNAYHYWDEIILQSSNPHKQNSYTDKPPPSLYQIGALMNEKSSGWSSARHQSLIINSLGQLSDTAAYLVHY